ncbi:replication initiator protein A [Holzapfeliella sp. He02]|uniref:Replication initiator protein A n=1 Tax=Holzapfeliella saturejae TaxID=3082953 RepID=A0ABU8SI25_9LACO
MTQFIQLNKSVLKNKELNSNDKLALSLLTDRMKSSVKRDNFFDKKQDDFYVIYTIDEMMEDLNLSKGTTVNIFKKLEKLGYIKKARCFNGATKIFLTEEETTVSSKIEPPKVQKLESNHTNSNHTNYTNDTNDTWDVLEDIIENKVKAEPHTEEVVEKPKEEVSEIMKKDAVEVLGQSLTESGLPEPLVATLKTYAFNDSDKLYNYAGIIFKAKSVAKKNAERLIGPADAAFRFELNNFMTNKLTSDIKKIIITSQRVAKNKAAYIMRSLINLFEEQANAYLVA